MAGHVLVAVFEQVVHALRANDDAVIVEDLGRVAGDKGRGSEAILAAGCDDDVGMKLAVMPAVVLCGGERGGGRRRGVAECAEGAAREE